MPTGDDLILAQEKHLDLIRHSLDSYINIYKVLENALTSIRNLPDFLSVFTSDEVMEINERQRKIPGMIEDIEVLRQIVCLENYSVVESGEIKEETERIEKELKILIAFFEEKKNRSLSKKMKVVVYIIYVFLHPIKTLFSWAVIPYYKVREMMMKRKVKKMRKNK